MTFSVARNVYRVEWITVHNEWEWMWQEAILASFKALLRHLPWQNEENTNIVRLNASGSSVIGTGHIPNKRSNKRVTIAVILYTRVREKLGLNLGRDAFNRA
jgi:hypothetical protein